MEGLGKKKLKFSQSIVLKVFIYIALLFLSQKNSFLVLTLLCFSFTVKQLPVPTKNPDIMRWIVLFIKINWKSQRHYLDKLGMRDEKVEPKVEIN